MATKDIADLQVCLAIAKCRESFASSGDQKPRYADDILMEETGQPSKVVDAALERASRRGYIDCGMWLRGGWLTELGVELVRAAKESNT